MKFRACVLSVCMIAGLAGCSHPDSPESKTEHEQKSDQAARKAGHAAYNFAQSAKAAARDLGRKLQRATEQAQKGWNDAKHDRENQKK